MNGAPAGNSDPTAAGIGRSFAERGFAVVPDLVDADGLAALRAGYDSILARAPGAVGAHDRMLGGLTRQVMNPEQLHPVFAGNAALDAAAVIAAELTGGAPAVRTFSMLIYKPPGHPFETPWHQDLSYAAKPSVRPGVAIAPNTVVQFWLALDDVDENMGCMEFIAGVHQGPLLEHYVAGGDPMDDGRLLAIKEPEVLLDLARAEKQPLTAGSATVHGYTTPHRTGPNRTARERRAYIFSFADPEVLARAAAAVAHA